MKWLLIASLALNLIFAGLYFREVGRSPLERIIVEEKKQVVPQEVIKVKEVIKEIPGEARVVDFIREREDFEETMERMESARREYLQQELKFSEDEMARMKKLKKAHEKKVQEFFSGRPPGKDLSFKDRRDLLMLEERHLEGLRKIFGQRRWEQYEKFREEYNLQGASENGPFVIMEP